MGYKLQAIPRSVYAMTHLWTLSDRGEITPREAYRATKVCSRILQNRGMTNRFKFSIEVDKMTTSSDFLAAYADMPLAGYELEALFIALTR